MDKIQILTELYIYKNFNSRTDFAKFLGITPQSLNHWFTRGTYDIELLAKKMPEISPRWLILGEGPMLESAEKCAPGAVDQRENGDNWAVFDRLQARIEALVAENALLKAELKKRPTVHLSTDTQPQTMAV